MKADLILFNGKIYKSNKEKEFMGWMWGRNDGALKVFELSNDSARINDEYMKRGYLDAKISSPALQSDMQTYTADLSYFIKEGVRYKITSISIENPVWNARFSSLIINDGTMTVRDRSFCMYSSVKPPSGSSIFDKSLIQQLFLFVAHIWYEQ